MARWFKRRILMAVPVRGTAFCLLICVGLSGWGKLWGRTTDGWTCRTLEPTGKLQETHPGFLCCSFMEVPEDHSAPVGNVIGRGRSLPLQARSGTKVARVELVNVPAS
ncbi:MAG: hypothetical protein QOH40_2195 [Arthrobacter pascens]|nr:hypothetical protein [Arthrobacter pascens]